MSLLPDVPGHTAVPISGLSKGLGSCQRTNAEFKEAQPMHKVCSIFSQVLKLLSRGGFEKVVKEREAERGFTNRGQSFQSSPLPGGL
jgi:hypothetical protein